MADFSNPTTSGLQVNFDRDVFVNEESEEEIVVLEEEICLLLSDEDSELDFKIENGPTPSAIGQSDKHEDTCFIWNDDTFVPKIHRFEEENCGINISNFQPDETTTEAEFFCQIVSENLMTSIVTETNGYATQCLSANPTLPKRSIMCNWTATTVSEMYLFIALSMLMVRNKKVKLSEYWSTDWLLHNEQFTKMMPRDRYIVLLRMLHFCDNTKQPTGNHLFKICEIQDMFIRNFKSLLHPFENLCINESLVLFKGRLGFKQYIKTKRHCFDIKLFVLRDVKTGFVLDVIVYTGKKTNINVNPGLEFSGSIVIKMLEPYLEKGHTLYTDNWYTSPTLSNELHARKTNSCGSVNPWRKHMPKFEHDKIPKGSREMKATENMMVVRWQDKREVMMLTTIHCNEMKKTGKFHFGTNEPIVKPECIVSYNSCMGSVDRCDLLLNSIEFMRKSTKWYKKLFFHLVDISLLNAYALYKLHKGKKIPLASFQLEVIRQLFEKHSVAQIRRSVGRPSNAVNTPTRLTARHFPALITATRNVPNPLRRCRVCSHTMKRDKKRKQTRFICNKCDVPLCIVPCFEIYHTESKF